MVLIGAAGQALRDPEQLRTFCRFREFVAQNLASVLVTILGASNFFTHPLGGRPLRTVAGQIVEPFTVRRSGWWVGLND